MKKIKVKAWAIVSRGGVLIGGGEKRWFGYTPLCTYRTKLGAKQHLSSMRNDVVVPVEITYSLPSKLKK